MQVSAHPPGTGDVLKHFPAVVDCGDCMPVRHEYAGEPAGTATEFQDARRRWDSLVDDRGCVPGGNREVQRERAPIRADEVMPRVTGG